MRLADVRCLAWTLLVSLCALPLTAQAAPDTTIYPVLNHGRLAGRMTVIEGDGETVVRVEFRDRNRGQWLETRYRSFHEGWPASIETYAIDNTTGETGERTAWFEASPDSVRWGSGEDTNAESVEPGLFYQPFPGSPVDAAMTARFLLEDPSRRVRVVSGEEVRAQIVAEAMVTVDGAPERLRLVTLGAADGPSTAVWVDEEGEFFASDAGWFITVRPGAGPTLPTLRAVEYAHWNAEAALLADELMPEVAGPLVVSNGDVFDAERGVIVPGTTVVIEGDRIVAVGPAAAVDVPPDATVIDATGRTVIPGMWEMHGHLFAQSQLRGSIQKLAAGITTVRDLAADEDAAVSQRDRADAGEIVSPRLVLAGFIEGPGAWAGPTAAIVGTVDEALEWIELYDSLGYVQLKLYNIVHPDIVPAIAEEARRRGMLLSGHIPRGLSVEAAVELGYDEIQHAAFLFSTHFQDSLYVPEMRPYSGVASIVAPDFDVDSREMTDLIDFLAERGTVIDGTFNIWEGPRTLIDDLTPQSESYRRLLRRLHEAGVPLVAGTDRPNGLWYHQELALYEDAGIPAPKVLQIATIDAARHMRQDEDYGSIAVGKVADLAIIDGNPAERIVDLWFVEEVIRAGVPYRTENLRQATGWEAPEWWMEHIRDATGREP